MAALHHHYRYARRSAFEAGSSGAELRLIGSESEQRGCFFRGALVHPRLTALCLRAISDVVGTRFHVPPAMLERILREADPVVTASREMLRFEGFSGCCSVYARLDIDPSGFDADELSPGTTNVDFQAPLRAALARVRPGDSMALAVDAEAVTVETNAEEIVEKKVPLPVRWIKGFGEAQALLARMTPRGSVGRGAALSFVRSLPRAPTRHRAWVIPSGNGLRLTHRAVTGGVPLSAVERLRVLEGLVPHASRLSLYAEDEGGGSAWQLDLDGQAFTLVLSPERWRGFSGEGGLLRRLAASDADALVERVRGALAWQDEIRSDEFAQELEVDEGDVEAALAVLASRGLVGFDIRRGAYFHRVLPFDLSAVDAMHPRLVAARRLVDKGAVEIRPSDGGVKANVTSGKMTYHVATGAEGATCTCTWWGKHRGDRGPCKHVLAVEMLLEVRES